MWASSKLARCRPESIPEYAWLYGMADSNGNFEMDEIALYVLFGRAYGIRRDWTFHQFLAVLEDFHENGLLFMWKENSKTYGHWTGSELPGRLPELTKRHRYEHLKVHRTPEQLLNTNSEVSAYIERCIMEPSPQAQMFPSRRLLPPETGSEKKISQSELMAEAEQNVDARIVAAQESDERFPYWKQFWNLYPPESRGSQADTRKKFFMQSVLDCVASLEHLREWLASEQWRTGHVPNSEKFFELEKFKASPPVPREKANGRGIGPATRTAEDKLERTRRAMAARGFHH
jgi:hypothetical protein